MGSTHQHGTQAHWVPAADTHQLKMAPGPTVNLSAVSATLNAGGGATPGYSTASSPFARGSSTHSSPYISRTGSGASDGSTALGSGGHHLPLDSGAAAAAAVAAAVNPSDLAAAALQALSRQASLAAAAAAGSPGGSRCTSPAGASTPRPNPGRSNLGPQQPSDRPQSLSSIEATLHGLAISGAVSPASSGPVFNFHAPPSTTMPQQAPVEVFAKFPQEAAGTTGRPTPQHHPRPSGVPRHGSHFSPGTAYGPAASAAMSSGPAAFNPGTAAGRHGAAAAAAAGYMPGMHAPHQAAFFVGSPPGGYHPGMTVFAGPGAPMPGHLPAAPSFPGAAYFPQRAVQAMGASQQQHQQQAYVMHPFYGMMPHSFPPPPPPQFGVYPAPGMVPARAAGAAGPKTAYDSAEYARQYQAMMSYMQGYGVMVSPGGSPERTSARTSSQPGFRRTGSSSQDRREETRGTRLSGGRPSRLSLDMSASKSENGDAHKLDPELAPLVAEDKSELQAELLEEFKASREARQWTLQDLKGHLYPFCRDQHGSRLVQQQLETADQQMLSELFAEVRHKLLPLMVDVFGNYVVQRFLERGGIDVQQAVADAIRGKALPLSLQMYGCRVVQKALEVLPQEERVSICSELTEHTLRCVRDQNGNHVVQKCIECVQPSDPAREMIETIVNKGQSLSTHTFGCRLVQRVLEFCSIAELRDQVITDVLGNILALSHDQYGNYVVQHLVTKGPEEARTAIVGRVAPQVMTLAQHKYASNVVEACLKHGSQYHRDAIINQMIGESQARPAALMVLMRDQFGNYVVQRALEVSTPAQRDALLQAIKPHLEQLKKYTYGKHIVNKVEAMLAAQQQAAAAVAAPAAAVSSDEPAKLVAQAEAPAGPEDDA